MKNWIKKIKAIMAIDTVIEHDKQGLFIPNRQVSWLVVSLFCFCGISFMLGYFWGHKRAIDRFVAKLEEESFADRINYALYTMNDRDSSEFEQDDESTNGNEEQEGVGEESAPEQEDVTEVEEISVEETAPTQPDKIEQNKQDKTEQKVFFAPLAGFGTLQKAQEFVQKIKNIEPRVLVETRVSKNTKGRTITWFQAITGEFTSKQELETVLKRLRKEAHIKDEIKITEKRKG